jgi:predicted O-methyltransferase YrrM
MTVSSIFNVFGELNSRYNKNGMSVMGGFCPALVDSLPSAKGNFIKKDNILLSSSAGISNEEAFIIHGLCEQVKPKNILIIGNSYGFSTVFLALSNPDSNLLAFDKYRTEGIKVTNQVLSGLDNKLVVEGSTPDDISPLVQKHFKGEKLDFVLIDAVHTNEMQIKEFNILKNLLSEQSVVVFHDVIKDDMIQSFELLKEENKKFNFRLINKSTTGLGVCFKSDVTKELRSYLDYFSIPENEVLDFLTLMLKSNGLRSQSFYKGIKSNLNFLPHPQK